MKVQKQIDKIEKKINMISMKEGRWEQTKTDKQRDLFFWIDNYELLAFIDANEKGEFLTQLANNSKQYNSLVLGSYSCGPESLAITTVHLLCQSDLGLLLNMKERTYVKRDVFYDSDYWKEEIDNFPTKLVTVSEGEVGLLIKNRSKRLKHLGKRLLQAIESENVLDYFEEQLKKMGYEKVSELPN